MSDVPYSPATLKAALAELRRRGADAALPAKLRTLLERLDRLERYALDQLAVQLWDELTGIRRRDETTLRMLEAEIAGQGWTVAQVLDAIEWLLEIGLEVLNLTAQLTLLTAKVTT